MSIIMISTGTARSTSTMAMNGHRTHAWSDMRPIARMKPSARAPTAESANAASVRSVAMPNCSQMRL